MTPAESAAVYSAHGWRPFALRTNDKRPQWPGWQTAELGATLDALAANRAANVGIAVPPGFVVLDIDTKGDVTGFDTLAAYPPLPDTLAASTPSGGRHCWYKLPPGLSVGNRVGIAAGLDIRTDGGFVAVAPSVIDGRRYEWLNWDTVSAPQIADAPAWLLELAQRRPAPATTQAGGTIPAGTRNAKLTRIAGRFRAEGLDADEMLPALELVNERRCSPPLDDHEVATIAASVGRYPKPLEPWQVFGQAPLPAGALAAPARSGLRAPGISEAEMNAAHVTPDCIVENLLFADVACLIAPGGIGKTTVMLYASACIALGRPVFGETVRKPGRVLFLTAEDSRQILVARLRACVASMGLDDAQRRKILDGVRIADVSGQGFKLTEVVGDVVRPSPNVAAVIALAREIDPVVIVVDPAVSFGVGESRVNDAEQGLIDAARGLRNDLNCCVLYVHHSGKQNAREKTLDQYSGRGGSAFADGSRMVLVLQDLSPADFKAATGQHLSDGETGLILARPKLSYCPPQPPIYIKRKGFAFEHVAPLPSSKGAKLDAAADQLWQLLVDEMQADRRHSKATLEQVAGETMKRAEIRGALARLEASGRIEYRDDTGTRKHGPQRYIHPLTSPTTFGEVSRNLPKNEAITPPVESRDLTSPPLKEITWRRSSPPVLIPLFPHFAKKGRRGCGEVGEVSKIN
jgi:RecA-family ATPase